MVSARSRMPSAIRAEMALAGDWACMAAGQVQQAVTTRPEQHNELSHFMHRRGFLAGAWLTARASHLPIPAGS